MNETSSKIEETLILLKQVLMQKEKVGIGITTRARPETLDICLKHFHHFWPKGYDAKLIVIDDNTTEVRVSYIVRCGDLASNPSEDLVITVGE